MYTIILWSIATCLQIQWLKKVIFKILCLRQFALSIKMLAPFYWSQWMVLVCSQNQDVFMNVCGSLKLKPECHISYKLLSFSGHWHNTRRGYFQRPCLGFILNFQFEHSLGVQSPCSITRIWSSQIQSLWQYDMRADLVSELFSISYWHHHCCVLFAVIHMYIYHIWNIDHILCAI